MRITNVVSFTLSVLLFQQTFAESNYFGCEDFRTSVIGNIFGVLAEKNVKSEIQTKLLLATKESPIPLNVKNYTYNDLLAAGIKESKKTYILVHGFHNDAYTDWVAQLKEELLKTFDVNVFIVNWGSYSHRWNYLDTVRAMPKVGNEIFTSNYCALYTWSMPNSTTPFQKLNDQITNFSALQEIEISFKSRKSQRKVLWNRLYFIGHSLGAHLSGQIAHLLKKDDFYTVERITGLDPARPCFLYCDSNLRLDKSHAEFVDVIHTQAGNSSIPVSFGAIDPLGHIDFYVNGGVMQPECERSYYIEVKKMICSHAMATNYFMESIVNLRTRNTCRFNAYEWDRTFDSAQKILEARRKSESCSKCPEMGIGASKSKGTGSFLVFTGTNTPHCRFIDSQMDHTLLKKSLARLNVKDTSDTDPYEKYYMPDGNNV